MPGTMESDNMGIEANEGQQIEVLCKGLQESQHLTLTGSRQSDFHFTKQHLCSGDTLAREGTLAASHMPCNCLSVLKGTNMRPGPVSREEALRKCAHLSVVRVTPGILGPPMHGFCNEWKVREAHDLSGEVGPQAAIETAVNNAPVRVLAKHILFHLRCSSSEPRGGGSGELHASLLLVSPENCLQASYLFLVVPDPAQPG